MKYILSLFLVALLAGCAPVYYASPVVYAPAPVQMYYAPPPVYVPSCSFVDQWDAVYYAWRRVQVCR